MNFMESSVNVRYFRGLKCHFLNIEVKSKNEWIVVFSKKKRKKKNSNV